MVAPVIVANWVRRLEATSVQARMRAEAETVVVEETVGAAAAVPVGSPLESSGKEAPHRPWTPRLRSRSPRKVEPRGWAQIRRQTMELMALRKRSFKRRERCEWSPESRPLAN